MSPEAKKLRSWLIEVIAVEFNFRSGPRVAPKNGPKNRPQKETPKSFALKDLGMEDNGLEPMTSCMPCKRSPN